MPSRNVFDLFRLEGRVALITGGSKGLGLEMAGALAEAGATCVLVARDEAVCAAAAAAVSAATGRSCLSRPADVTDEAQVRALFGRVADELGRLDVLICSAGVNIRHPIEEYPLDEFRQVVEVNLVGTWLCCRAAATIMKPAGAGSVICLGSALSLVGLAERTAYCASKAAVIGLVRTLALEWAGSGVRCNAICPGPFLTDMNRKLLDQPAAVATLLGRTALGRWAELDEIKGAALYLASDASSYMTGANLVLDGGWTAQ